MLFQTVPAANDVATRPDLKSHADATTMMMITADAARIPWSIVAVDKRKLLLILLFLLFFYARALDNVEMMTTVTVKASPLSSSSLPPTETTQATVTCSFSLVFFLVFRCQREHHIKDKPDEREKRRPSRSFLRARSLVRLRSFLLTNMI